jgi:hypothetical protein
MVNEALRKELELLRSKSAVQQLLAYSPRQEGYSYTDIFEFIAKFRHFGLLKTNK